MQLKRSKINAMIEYLELNKTLNDNPQFMNDLEIVMDYMPKLLELMEFITDGEFTNQEYLDTMEYVSLINEEKYEDLANLDINILEDVSEEK